MNKGNVILKGVAFFLAALVLASLVRVGFFCAYRGDSVSVGQFLPAFALGARVDAKWLALGLWPAWAAVLLFGLFGGSAAVWFRRAAVALAAVAAFAFFLLDFINYFFYGFYGTPISSIIFGFFQDDTLAVTRTVINEWPRRAPRCGSCGATTAK